MKIIGLIAFATSIAFSALLSTTVNAESSGLDVTVFSAKEANVNAFIFTDLKGTVIVDTTRNSKEAHELAALARSKGIEPNVIFITHGHPDHYLGMGALKTEFPQAKFIVATQKVKDDIINFTKFMESANWLENEPAMKIKSQTNPDGFDYENEITVLETKDLVLPAGEHLLIKSDFPSTEAPNETLLFSKELNSVFVSDLAYNKVHIWLGVGVDKVAINHWKNELNLLKKEYSRNQVKVYPGHGPVSDTTIFEIDHKYIDDLLYIVKSSKDQTEAMSAMINKYPDWQNTDFILAKSIEFQFQQLKE